MPVRRSVARSVLTAPFRVRWLRRALLILLVPPLLAIAFFQAAVWFWPYQHELLTSRHAGAWIEDRHGIPLAAFVADDQQWYMPLSVDQISPHLLNAIVAAEDSRFFEHGGVDWMSAAAACWQDLRAMAIRRGASTITMQLYHLRDPQPRSFPGKLVQAIRACQIERQQSKQQILVEYINLAPFGGNLVGAGAASWRYFARPCRELSIAQAALLAGLPQNPARFRPDRYPQRAAPRRAYVLQRMLALRMITPEQYQHATAEPVEAAWHPLPQNREKGGLPLADAAMPTLRHLADSSAQPQLHTTLDAGIQRQAATAAREQLQSSSGSGVSALAVVVLDTATAECRAAVSLAQNPDAADVDLTRCRRSTGSTLKPLIYAAAFDAGIANPETLVKDSPSAWAGYVPSNFDRSFRGTLRAADALAESRNIPALCLLSQLGLDRAAAVMGACGLESLSHNPHRYGLSLAIGGAESSPWEIAEAYATLARGGIHRAAGCLPSAHPAGTQPDAAPVLRPIACWQTLASISDAARTAQVCPDAVKSNVAWKTGTSSGRRDAWCAAVTPAFTVVVWMGNPSGQGSNTLVGHEAAAPLALRLIAALDGPHNPWPRQAGDTAPAAHAARHIPKRLTLLSPADGMQIVYNTDLPADRQQLLLQVATDDATSAGTILWWFVDGAPLCNDEAGNRRFWSPSPGTHEIRVTDASGRWASAKVTVR